MKKIILTLTLLLSLAIPAYNQGRPTYPLTMSAGSYGTVLPATETVDSGAVINIYASPKPGYVLTSWHQTGGAHIADTTKDTTTVHLSAAGACAASFHWRATAPIYSYYLNQSTEVCPDWPTLCRDRYNRIWSAYNVASGGTGSHYGTKYCNWIIQQVEWKRDTMINLGPQITIEAGSAPVDSFAGRGHCIVPIRTPGDAVDNDDRKSGGYKHGV
jgi:Divergent InlB B-repeat domain